MLPRLFVLVLGIIVLAGCSPGMTGTYQAEVERVAPPPERVDPGYSLEDVRKKLADAPRFIVLESGGRFETREGNRVIWEGAWRREDDQLILRAQRVQGIDVTPALQDDKKYPIRGGAIVDESTYGYYGLHLLYRKR